MDRSNRLIAVLTAILAATTFACIDASAATVGEAAPAFSLTGIDGAEHTLADLEGKVVVLEWINPKCPFSRRHAEEKTMVDLAQDKDVVWLAINSTNPKSGDYMEPAEHKAFNDEHGIQYPVLYDPSGEVGQAYGAKTTPHMYVISADGTLLYDGAIDDDPAGRMKRQERTNYVAGALADQREGQPVEPATTKPYGCSVKY